MLKTAGTILEPDFGGPLAARGEIARASRRLVYPAVGALVLWAALAVTSEVLTFLNQDVLDRPVKVEATEGKTLVLSDGRRVPLPFLKRLPGEAPAFRSALARGVEVDPGGNVFGLLNVSDSCGMTLQHRSVTRVNLSELAAALDPVCVDGAGIDPVELALLRESAHYGMSRVNGYIHSNLRRWHDAFTRAGGAP